MPTGHRSHQIGLDVDIWFLPAPPTPFVPLDREEVSPCDWRKPPTSGVVMHMICVEELPMLPTTIDEVVEEREEADHERHRWGSFRWPAPAPSRPAATA